MGLVQQGAGTVLVRRGTRSAVFAHGLVQQRGAETVAAAEARVTVTMASRLAAAGITSDDFRIHIVPGPPNDYIVNFGPVGRTLASDWWDQST